MLTQLHSEPSRASDATEEKKRQGKGDKTSHVCAVTPAVDAHLPDSGPNTFHTDIHGCEVIVQGVCDSVCVLLCVSLSGVNRAGSCAFSQQERINGWAGPVSHTQNQDG